MRFVIKVVKLKEKEWEVNVGLLSQILLPFQGQRLIEWFNDLTELWHDTSPIKPAETASPQGLTQWIHYKNFVVWHLEEKIRIGDLSPDQIVEIQKSIDLHNLKRLEAMEQIDIWIENVLVSAGIRPGREVEVNSETIGSIVDRLSILTLKIFHLDERINNEDTAPEERQETLLRKNILFEQRADVASALDRLLLEYRQARKRHCVYRQFKIYNDPNFHWEDYL